jgi:hypothetical protein
MAYAYRRRRLPFSAYIFAGLLVLTFFMSLVIAMVSAGPIVLGSEMNGNGSMEYLCLGTGCDAFSASGLIR